MMPMTRWSRATARLTILAVWTMTAWGCASHADFVKVQEDVRSVAKLQDQAKKRDEDLQHRLQALEAKAEAKPPKPAPGEAAKGAPAVKELEALKQQIEELTDRLNDMDRRVARLQDSQYAAPLPPPALPKTDPGTGQPPGEPSRQSKPAKVPEPPPVLPGTPGISPTSAYNLAYNDYLNGRYELAITGFERFLKDFPTTSLAPNAHYWIGESYYSLKDYPKASQAFDVVVHEYPRSEKVAPALFKLGLAAAETGDPLKARTYLKRVIEEFAASNEAKLAKNKLAELR